MRLKLFKKYFFTTSVIIIASLTGMMMILVLVFNNYTARVTYDSLEKTCHAVADFTNEAVSENEESPDGDYGRSLYYLISNLANVSDYDILIADTDGIIRGCSCAEWGEKSACEHSRALIPSDLIERVGKEETCLEINTLGIYDYPHHIAATGLKNGDESVGVVIATAPMSAIRSLIKTVTKLYLLSAAIPIIIMFFAIYAMTYRLTKPMKQMSQAAKAMAKGDFSRRIPVTSDDEIGELAVSFNQMTNSLVQLEGMRRSFIANVSHELKTPMTTIAGFIDGIIDGTIEQDKQEYYLGIVSNEIKRLSRLVQSMLQLAKLESGEFMLRLENFDFRELLLDVVISQEQRIEQNSLNIEGLDNLPDIQINADRDLIHQVVYNLVDNAIKFCNEGGKISFLLRTDGKRMIFGISNTGKGIPPEALPLVFERFYKADKSRSANKNSTGLGLHIAKTIMKCHGGTITVSSKENEFTTFEITLPLSK